MIDVVESAEAEGLGDSGRGAAWMRRAVSWGSGVVLLGAIGAAGWMAWRGWNQPRTAEGRVVLLEHDPNNAVRRSGRGWTVYGGMGELSIEPGAERSPRRFSFRFRNEGAELLTAEQTRALQAAGQALSGATTPLKLTADQRAALAARWERRFDASRIEPDEAERLGGLLAEFESADAAVGKEFDAVVAARDAGNVARQSAAERKRDLTVRRKQQQSEQLCAAVEALAEQRVARYRKDAIDRAAVFLSLLRPEQKEKLTQARLADPARRRR